ncbi:MAG: acyltransferase family protein [Deltaproteobacteria bacterium]|nr:MAG: acyltransferase family protein [Deltaproteobacteria bacterium]
MHEGPRVSQALLHVPKDLGPRLAQRVLPPEERTRLAAYALKDAGLGVDAFGTRKDALAAAYALGYLLHEHYFRVQSRGHASIPTHGAAVIAGNHSGVLPFDAMMVATDVFRNTWPPRLVRYMVDYFVYRIPFLGVFFRGVGQVPGTRANFDGLVREGHIVGVFPEGAAALGKPAERRYELYPFSPGHVELAARHRVPVIPFGLVGAEEQQHMVANLAPLAKILRLPYVPITTTFPWLGPLGLLPKPVRYFIEYGEPIHVDPAVLSSVRIREREVERVRTAVRDLLRRGLAWRKEFERGRS